jgi:tRNA nucleotidyltransferase (CCA-adding enzyme)
MYEELSKKILTSDDIICKELRSFAKLIKSVGVQEGRTQKPEAYVVGGYIRDSLLSLDPKDVDIEVYGIDADKLDTLLKEKYEEPVADSIGKVFNVTKIRITPEIEFDVNVIDQAMDLKTASGRRDFTFNAMNINLHTGEFFDFYGGLEDLQNKILRCTDYVQFQDDPLRVYRAIQFVARMGFVIEDQTWSLLSKMVVMHALDDIPKERVTVEFEKLLLKAEKPSIGFDIAYKIHLIRTYYPELRVLKSTPQDSVWHPEGDVWIHTLMVLDQAARIIRKEGNTFTKNEKLTIMLGALCHDLGKAITTEEIKGRIISHGHESAGEPIVMEFLNQFTFPDAVKDGVIFITKMHMQPGNLYRAYTKKDLSEGQYINAVRRLLTKMKPLSWKVFIACSEADSRGRLLEGVIENTYLPGDMFSKTIIDNKLDEQLDPLIMGRDLIDLATELGIDLPPGKKFGEYIKQVENLRDKGEISTKDEAIIYLKNVIK